jgi:hypothetical protein
MKVVNIRLIVSGKSYEEIVEKAEKRLASFLNISVEELENKMKYEFNFYESNDDGVSPSTFTAEVYAKMK